MAMKTCAECGKEFSDQARACVHCGAPNPRKAGPFAGAAKLVAGIALGTFALVFAYSAYLSGTPEAKERREDRKAIEQCEMVNSPSFHECFERRRRYIEKWGRQP